jgi:thiamine transport system permease protein
VQLFFTALITWFYSRFDQRNHEASGKARTGELRVAHSWRQKIVVWGGALVLALFLLSPLLALSLRSVVRLDAARGERGSVQSGLTLDYYRELFINRRNAYFYVPPVQAVINSLTFAALTVAIALPLGIAATSVIKRNRKKTRWFELLVMLPLGASAVTVGLGFLLTFNRPPLDVKHFPLLIPIVHSLVAFPFVVRVLYPAWAGLPSSLLQAGAVLGASPWRVFREVELPLLVRPLLAAVVFCFTISLGEFGATSFLVIPERPTLPVAIYRYLSQPGALNYGQALAMATVLMLVCGLAIFIIEMLQPAEQVELL